MVLSERADLDAVVPVVVVGAGPTGLALALELALQSVPVVLVERRTEVDDRRPRAKTISARTMELFQRWGVSEAVRREAPIPASWSSRITFSETVVGPELAHLDGAFGLDLPRSDIVAPPAQQMPQPALERLLRKHVAALRGVTLLEGWRAVAATQNEQYVELSVEDAADHSGVLRADYLVGADGARSVVRSAMGVDLAGRPGGRPNVNITFRSSELAALTRHAPSIHHWVLGADAPGVVGPLDLRGTWWAIATGVEALADDDEARSIVRSMVGAEIDCEIVATDPWQAQLALADSYRVGRMFLAGDAAHLNPPWGGHGFNTGVGDAMNLAWKLAASLHGWGSEALLDSYETERRPIAAATIDIATENMRALSPDLGGAASAEEVLGSKRGEFHSLGLVLGYGYGYTPNAREQALSLQQYRPLAEAGNRLPDRRLADGGTLYDTLGIGFTVIGRGALATAIAEALNRRGVPVVSSAARPANSGHSPLVIVVRPDQHIAWSGKHTDDVEESVTAMLRGFASAARV